MQFNLAEGGGAPPPKLWIVLKVRQNLKLKKVALKVISVMIENNFDTDSEVKHSSFLPLFHQTYDLEEMSMK